MVRIVRRIGMSLFLLFSLFYSFVVSAEVSPFTEKQIVEELKAYPEYRKAHEQALAKVFESENWQSQQVWDLQTEYVKKLAQTSVMLESFYNQTPVADVRATTERDIEGMTSHLNFVWGKLGGYGTGLTDDKFEISEHHLETRILYHAFRLIDYDDDDSMGIDLHQWLQSIGEEVPLG
ncbi:hypothetical protein [Vibrio sp. SCSIO 43136]|uniref:hypothetical protein n=1 Tax=Vibrio sp. SCSIO 43136 TaxID=2819101 RepID=UPI0020759F4E|nr:hypothetical protein [Vibrio sp. SCSIO 43136]USD66365.1 hypothetical protein J4N39_06020 [Vibrio sp. SCSIO 43136]